MKKLKSVINKMQDKLSIIIPCYNCAETLEEAINSFYKQGLIENSFEIILVDDKSTDDTKKTIIHAAKKHKEIRAIYHERNLGGGAARNTAVSNTNGDIIFCLDSDDLLPDDTLPRMIKLLKDKKADGVLFAETRFFDSNNRENIEIVKNIKVGSKIEFIDLFKKGIGFINKVNFLYTKKAFEIAGGYPTNHGFDTQTFGARFLSKGLISYVCPNTYYLHRRYSKPSYFDREYMSGRLSINTYLMYEDIFFLFSNKIKKLIINYDIFNNKKLGKNNLEKTVLEEFEKSSENEFFIDNYKKYLNSNGEMQYYNENIDSDDNEKVFARAIILGKLGNIFDSKALFDKLHKSNSKSRVLKMKTQQKKITLLMHNGGRLGNQLWLMAALYSYGLEKNYEFDTHCFFEYQQYFNIKTKSITSRTIGYMYEFLQKVKVPEEILRDFSYMIFGPSIKFVALLKKDRVIFDNDEIKKESVRVFFYKIFKTITRIIVRTYHTVIKKDSEPKSAYGISQNQDSILFLPPSSKIDPFMTKTDHMYFYGWLFRNPEGIIKYQKQIKDYFTPKSKFEKKVTDQVNELRKKYEHVVGVHVRLGDCKNEFIDNDRVAYSEDEVLKILNEYVIFSGKKVQDICFIICSDGTISEKTFEGLNVIITDNNPAEDIWILSLTDIIVGADSSFAITASLLGNIPFIVFKRGIDWDYYKDKKVFFENKYVKRFIY